MALMGLFLNKLRSLGGGYELHVCLQSGQQQMAADICRFCSVALLEDVTGKGHTTRVIGDTDVYGMFVQLPE